MEKKYTIHPVDACLLKNNNHADKKVIKILLQGQGTACRPDQRKEAEMLVRLLNWYDSIDKSILSEQLDELRVIGDQYGPDTLSGHCCEGIGNMVSDLLTIGEDLEQLDNTNHKDNIERILISKLASIGIDVPDNFEQMVQFVFEDVMETSNYPEYNDSDIMTGFRRFIENDNSQIM